jgi:quercetin dioxygenase-like cupin family protein/uncharacterized protein (DUF2249 family)
MSDKPLIPLGDEKILSLQDETQFAPNGIVSRTVLRTPTMRVVLFGFAEGQELTEHTSTQHALIQILSGECEFSLSGVARQLKTGAMLYMPPNLPHAVRATHQFSMLLTLATPAPQPETATESKGKNGLVEVDARGLEPPQPIVRILETLNTLPSDAALRARTDRRPMHLYSQLEVRGFVGTTEEDSDGSFITNIRRR